MDFTHNEKTYTVRDITRGERRQLAALYPAAFAFSESGTTLNGPGMHALCEATLRLSGLKDEDLVGMTAIEENAMLLGLANEYATGLAGKDSGA